MKTRHNLTMLTGGRWVVTTVRQTFRLDLGSGTVEIADFGGRLFPLVDDQRFRIRYIDVLELGRSAEFSMTIPGNGVRDYEYSWSTDPVVSITPGSKKRVAGFAQVDLSEVYNPRSSSQLTMCRLLEIDAQQLESMVAGGQLLRLVTRSGAVIYPLFQVDEAGRLLPGLDAVLCELAGGTVDPWTWWLWLTSAPEWAGGREVWELVREGRAPAVVRAAGRAAWAWRQ